MESLRCCTARGRATEPGKHTANTAKASDPQAKQIYNWKEAGYWAHAWHHPAIFPFCGHNHDFPADPLFKLYMDIVKLLLYG